MRNKLLITLVSLLSTSALMVNCSDKNGSANPESTKSKKKEMEREAPKPEADVEYKPGFEANKQYVTIKIPNKQGGHDVFKKSYVDKTDFAPLIYFNADYVNSSTKENQDKFSKKEEKPLLSVHMTPDENTIIAYYYDETIAAGVLEEEEHLGEMFVFRHGHINAIWKNYLIVDDAKIAKLAKNTGASILTTRRVVHNYYMDEYRGNDNYSLIGKEWNQYVLKKVTPILKEMVAKESSQPGEDAVKAGDQ